ncbi:MAG: response regulator transcription factor [Porticoccaceae bacterium]
MNYLIIDDDQAFCSVLSRVLVRQGHRVQVANNGIEAEDLCEKSDDIERVILDLKLESESGLAILTAVKKILPTVEVLILTGYSSITTAVEAIKLGAVNYLCKPASADEIIKAFSSLDGSDHKLSSPILPTSVNRLEWEHIQKVLNDNNGNISATARSLGMHRRTLQRKLQKKPSKQ